MVSKFHLKVTTLFINSYYLLISLLYMKFKPVQPLSAANYDNVMLHPIRLKCIYITCLYRMTTGVQL